MNTLFLVYLLYGIFLFVYLITAVFVLYHLARFTVSHAAAYTLSIAFVSVSAILLFANLSLFFTVPFSEIMSGNSSPLSF